MFHDETARHIAQYGRSIVGVFPCGDDDPGGFSFAYTIGNWNVRLPELLVIGTKNGGFLNDLSQQMLHRGRAFLDGQLVRAKDARLPVKLITAGAEARDEYAIQVGQYFGTEHYDIMQVLIPDRSGRFPDEPDCALPYAGIPVLRWRAS